MKINGLLLAVFLTGGAMLAAGQNSTSTQTASPSDQGSSAYGNNTYNQGAQTPVSSDSGSAAQQSPSSSSVTSAGTPQPPSPDANSNAGLQSRIDDALRNEPTLGASHVVSNVTDNAIELSGTVGSAKDKQTAERITASFNGNRKLTNNIVVTGAGHSDLAPNHSALNNGGVGNAPNPAANNGTNNPQK
jgi:osmotically-inducible protein OsmY